MLTAADLDAIAAEIVRRHGAHTVLLYGSQARGDATEHSDVDLVAVRVTGGPDRDVEPWRGWQIDLHLFDEADVPKQVEERAPALVDARVLLERDGWGRRILDGVRARLAAPPPAQTVGEVEALWAWADKMRGRVRAADPLLAAMQRSILLSESAGAWCQVRRRWYGGAKATLKLWRAEDPLTLSAFSAAAAPGAGIADLERLLDVLFPSVLRPAPREH